MPEKDLSDLIPDHLIPELSDLIPNDEKAIDFQNSTGYYYTPSDYTTKANRFEQLIKTARIANTLLALQLVKSRKEQSFFAAIAGTILEAQGEVDCDETEVLETIEKAHPEYYPEFLILAAQIYTHFLAHVGQYPTARPRKLKTYRATFRPRIKTLTKGPQDNRPIFEYVITDTNRKTALIKAKAEHKAKNINPLLTFFHVWEIAEIK